MKFDYMELEEKDILVKFANFLDSEFSQRNIPEGRLLPLNIYRGDHLPMYKIFIGVMTDDEKEKHLKEHFHGN